MDVLLYLKKAKMVSKKLGRCDVRLSLVPSEHPMSYRKLDSIELFQGHSRPWKNVVFLTSIGMTRENTNEQILEAFFKR